MRFKWNKNYLGWGLTAFFVILASLVVVFMLINNENIGAGIRNLFNAVIPIFYGFIIAYLLCPIVTFFEEKVFNKVFTGKNKKKQNAAGNLNVYVRNKASRIASILVAILIMTLIITAVISAIIPQLDVTVKILADNIPSYVKTLTEWVTKTFASFPEIGEEVTDIVKQAGAAIGNFLSSSVFPQVGDYLGLITSSVMSVVGFFMNTLLGLVISVYCLYSKELFSAQAKKVLYSIMRVKHANRLIDGARRVHHSFGSFITGTLIDSFIVACITFAVTTAFGIPFSLLVSVIMGIANIIPYFGPFIGALPSAFLILMEDPVKCLIFIIIILVIQNLNGNVLSPRILGESIGLSSFWVIFAILAGQGIFGFWGMIIGIPLFAVIYEALKAFIAERLKKKGLPSDSDSYTDIMSIEEETLIPVSLSKDIAEKEKIKQEKEEREKAEKKRIRAEKTERIKAKISSSSGSNKKQ